MRAIRAGAIALIATLLVLLPLNWRNAAAATYTDQTNVSFTSSGGLTSKYHVYAAGVTAPAGLLLQFHGDEDAAYCRQFSRPYLRAARVRPGLDLVEFARSFPDARGLLLDAFVEGYGGGGHVFDWTLIPPNLPGFLVLSGGLNADNVGNAIERVRPVAVDVSSGVEMGKGIKDHQKIAAFVAAVRKADESI